jgi:hypothetical protein
MTIKFTILCGTKALRGLPKLGFLVCKSGNPGPLRSRQLIQQQTVNIMSRRYLSRMFSSMDHAKGVADFARGTINIELPEFIWGHFFLPLISSM